MKLAEAPESIIAYVETQPRLVLILILTIICR
jgi:hypothetical protein